MVNFKLKPTEHTNKKNCWRRMWLSKQQDQVSRSSGEKHSVMFDARHTYCWRRANWTANKPSLMREKKTFGATPDSNKSSVNLYTQKLGNDRIELAKFEKHHHYLSSHPTKRTQNSSMFVHWTTDRGLENIQKFAKKNYFMLIIVLSSLSSIKNW